jgi:ferritin-like metal-binding protein YciE
MEDIMGVFTSAMYNSLDELFEHELRDLYDAEHRLAETLPKLVEKASDPGLKAAFERHLQETHGHLQRLETIFKSLGLRPEREKCQAMVGLLKEGSQVLDAGGDEHVLDAALIATAQRVEHYEMAGYGTARDFALHLGMHNAADLLQQTLDEEGAADHKLTDIAETTVNPATLPE